MVCTVQMDWLCTRRQQQRAHSLTQDALFRFLELTMIRAWLLRHIHKQSPLQNMLRLRAWLSPQLQWKHMPSLLLPPELSILLGEDRLWVMNCVAFIQAALTLTNG